MAARVRPEIVELCVFSQILIFCASQNTHMRKYFTVEYIIHIFAYHLAYSVKLCVSPHCLVTKGGNTL